MTWDKLLRLIGLLLGFGSVLVWVLDGHPPVSGVMTFAAALIAVPNVVGAHDSRRDEAGRAKARKRRT